MKSDSHIFAHFDVGARRTFYPPGYLGLPRIKHTGHVHSPYLYAISLLSNQENSEIESTSCHQSIDER